MPDSTAGGFAVINGDEFANDQRTITYIQNLGLPVSVSEGCWCTDIQLLAGCEVTGYDLPSLDPAPWYDPAIPESGDFAGFLTAEFEGLGSTYTRNSTDILTGGSVLGKLRPKSRTLTWRGYLFGRNCCAVLFGLRWLTATLVDAGGCDGCGEAELDILYCCPTSTEAIAEDCHQGLPIPPMGFVPSDDAFRTFYRVGLVEGPTILSQRKIGCGENCKGENCPGESCLIEVEFSLVAGNPFMHRLPVEVCVDGQFPECYPCLDCVGCFGFHKVRDGDPTLGDCVEYDCLPYGFNDCNIDHGLFVKVLDSELPGPSGCTNTICPTTSPECLEDPIAWPGCNLPVIPTISSFGDECGGQCDPVAPVAFCCNISNDIAGEFFETVPVIEIFSGALPLRNIEIRFMESPLGVPCCDYMDDPCKHCESLKILYIPAYTTLRIDGTSKRIVAICPGSNAYQPAESLALTPFSWPVLKCIEYCICVITDCLRDVAPDHFINIIVVPREM